MFDDMDVIHALHSRMTTAGSWVGNGRVSMDFLYVDETQDFTQAELLLLWRLMVNPNASFFAGDTAQAIARGVTFRFADITSMAHALTQTSAASQLLAAPVSRAPPKTTLVHNYRSHNGILRLAATIVQLLQYYFPMTIDSPSDLPPDRGVFDGPKPRLVRSFLRSCSCCCCYCEYCCKVPLSGLPCSP